VGGGPPVQPAAFSVAQRRTLGFRCADPSAAAAAAAGVPPALRSQFARIYPPPGAWGGLWRLPGSAEFHVLWTGGAECLGGAALAWAGLVRGDPAPRGTPSRRPPPPHPPARPLSTL